MNRISLTLENEINQDSGTEGFKVTGSVLTLQLGDGHPHI